MRAGYIERGFREEEGSEVFVYDAEENEVYLLIANTFFLGYPVLLCMTEFSGLALITHDRLNQVSILN